MEKVTSAGIVEPSTIDRRSVAGSLSELAFHLANIAPGRLALIAGDEIHSSGAADEVVALAEALGAPVFGSSWPARIPLPTSHPLWAGNMPTKATEIAEKLSGFDALFALGGKSLMTILFTQGPAVPGSCQVFQMSADVRDLGRTYATRLSVVGDIKASLTALLPLLRTATVANADVYASLRHRAEAERRAKREALAARAALYMHSSAIHLLAAAQEVVRAIGPDIAIVDEAIATSAHVRNFLNSPSSRQYSFFWGGALGWGMPAAVGCSLGLGREPVICLVGDGAALYSPQALWTAAHERLPVTFVVMNNGEYNVLKNFMKGQAEYASVRSNRFIAMEITSPSIDYVFLARSMGVPSCRVGRAGDVAPAIEAGIASRIANLVEIAISAT